MSWQGEIGTIVRYLVNDVDQSNYSYSDSRIETAILVSAQIVCSEIDFENAYIIDVEQCRLTPDPTDPSSPLATANKDDGFINLVALKTACVILGSELKTHSLNSVRVTDGPSSIDMTAIAGNIKYLYEDACKKYEEFKFNLKVGSSSVGKAILSPYSPGSDAINRSYDYVNGYFR